MRAGGVRGKEGLGEKVNTVDMFCNFQLHYHRYRLPIVQGATFSFLGPTIAILNLPEYKCPDASAMVNVTDPLTNKSSLGKQKSSRLNQ